MADKKISELPVATALTGPELFELVQGGVNKQGTPEMIQTFIGSGITREFNRAFAVTLVFDKHEIFAANEVMTDDIIFLVGSGLVDQASSMRLRVIADGIHSISFGPGFDFLYGITNGEVLPAGTYELYFLYTNGSVSVNAPGVSSESASATVLSTPSNFAVVPGTDPETELDLSWDDVSNESSYLIEFSLTGTGGWANLSSPAANATSATQSGLSAGNTRYYRIKAVGDGVNFLDSAFSSVIAGQTESAGDVSDPTFVFAPASGVTTWTVNKPIVITANEPIRNLDGTPITNNQAGIVILKQTNSGGSNIAHSWTIDGSKTIITITPTIQYGENQLVYWAINNVEDVNGNDITAVTAAQESTFTTTDYTFFNGTSNRLGFGDILDSLFTANDTNFWLELTINEVTLSGSKTLIAKNDTASNHRAFTLVIVDSDVVFGWFGAGIAITHVRITKWANALTPGEHEIVLKYDGSIDTNDGLDRVTLEIDGVVAGSKTKEDAGGNWPFGIFNSSAQLAVGMTINSAGVPVGTNFFAGEAKDFIVRSASGSVVEINVPNLRTGVDTSGNGRNGTWV